ncbi:deoxyribonuclease NucA/NucB-domain-containing protein [Hypoxylon trugodes]|uniref:deoxyribonuclease NucA/NucB-domain-containing protein n=1 Tax=Hypoxylon trugodes TaxID=326681 RepID=UPI00218F5CE0|nr:deoxyribonuclease NucA/NucB-domain-containing protein [Hypoxylon trugodes]KAI1387100.1 deoxyribonuclease NucA/NucB-domain-containing protein [Hypoxylon trugodes]
MKNLTLLASLIGLAAASSAVNVPDTGLEVRADPDDLMIFVCNDGLDEICTNMCYGAYCAGIGTALRYDQPDPSTKRNRRKAAGCIASGGNRCSTKQHHDPGYQCDEYPFASSVPNGGTNVRLNRCVPASQNRKQGGIISAFYKSSYCKGNNGGKCEFSVEFSNAGTIKYCNQQNCGDRDDNEVRGPNTDANPGDSAEDGTDDDPDAGQKKKRNGLGKRLPGAPVYRTSSGLELDLPRGAQIGQRAFVVLPRNATLWDEQAQFGNPKHVGQLHGDLDEEDEDYDYMLANLEIREDTIVEEISSAA